MRLLAHRPFLPALHRPFLPALHRPFSRLYTPRSRLYTARYRSFLLFPYSALLSFPRLQPQRLQIPVTQYSDGRRAAHSLPLYTDSCQPPVRPQHVRLRGSRRLQSVYFPRSGSPTVGRSVPWLKCTTGLSNRWHPPVLGGGFSQGTDLPTVGEPGRGKILIRPHLHGPEPGAARGEASLHHAGDGGRQWTAA